MYWGIALRESVTRWQGLYSILRIEMGINNMVVKLGLYFIFLKSYS